MYDDDIASVLITEQDIHAKVDALAKQIAADRPAGDSDLLLVGVLKG
ncbi:MAG TPA: hypoxanthine phosphoribosyltransferase, partial [Pseudonocardiaceae bacterium]|nr:hypoxanthine phosphoribosyltransferase [Pseudonocardiaceae bacterium]